MDRTILKQLYEKYQKEIYLYLFSLCKDRQWAEDLLQETFLKAILSLSEQHTNMRAWLYLVARNLYFNDRKKEKRMVSMEDTDSVHGESAKGSAVDIWENTPEKQLIVEEKKQMLYRAIASLKGQKKEILLMQYMGGLSQREIASVLHLTTENVRVLAYRARRELKVYMEEQGYDIS